MSDTVTHWDTGTWHNFSTHTPTFISELYHCSVSSQCDAVPSEASRIVASWQITALCRPGLDKYRGDIVQPPNSLSFSLHLQQQKSHIINSSRLPVSPRLPRYTPRPLSHRYFRFLFLPRAVRSGGSKWLRERRTQRRREDGRNCWRQRTNRQLHVNQTVAPAGGGWKNYR